MSRMTCCSATGCGCSITRPERGERGLRVFGIHRSTYYVWKRGSSGTGWRCCGRGSGAGRGCRTSSRRSSSSGSLPSRSAIPGWAPADRHRAAQEGGGIISPNGVWRCCAGTASTRAPSGSPWSPATRRRYEPPREPAAGAAHRGRRPGELVGIDCFYVGRLRGTNGAIWQLTAIDVCSSFAWAELVICPSGNPTAAQTSKLARRVAAELQAGRLATRARALRQRQRVPRPRFAPTLDSSAPAHTRIHAGRPQTNGHVEALHKTILEECWRPAFARYLYPRYTGLQPRPRRTTCATTTSTASTTAASPAAASPQTSSTVPARWSADEPHLSAHLGVRPA